MYENDKEKVDKFLEENRYSMRNETNSTIKKFFELPLDEQQKLFDQINSEDYACIRTAYTKLIIMAVKINKEPAESTSPSVTSWTDLPAGAPYTAFYLWQYFRVNLKRPTKEKFEIPLIE